MFMMDVPESPGAGLCSCVVESCLGSSFNAIMESFSRLHRIMVSGRLSDMH